MHMPGAASAPPLDLADIDLSDHDLFVDHPPHEVFDVLRTQAPVHWNPEPAPRSGFWSLTRYDDVVAVLRDTETYSSEAGGITLEEPAPALTALTNRMIAYLEAADGA